MTLSEEYPALASNKAPFIHIHFTLTLIHIRCKLPRTIKMVGVLRIEFNRNPISKWQLMETLKPGSKLTFNELRF